MVIDSDVSRLADGREKAAVMVAAIIASSLGFVDASVISVALPVMRLDLSAGFGGAQWIANAYTLMLAALVLVGGVAGDRYGVRDTFMAGIGAFMLASIACALSGSVETLVFFRALQGASAAFMVPGSLALIAMTFPREERGAAIGLWSTVSGLAAALGPIIGGLMIDWGGTTAWRWIFWINVPAGLVALFVLATRVRRQRPTGAAPLDWIGALLATLALGAISGALILVADGTGDTLIIIALSVTGLALAVGFLVFEARTDSPMLPVRLFQSKGFIGANLLTFMLYFALGGVLFFIPMTLIEAHHMRESAAGAVFLPFTITMALLARYSGMYADAYGARSPIVIGSAIVAMSLPILALAVAHGDYFFGVLPSMAVMGIGMGLVVAPLSTVVMTPVDDRLAGAASAVNNGVARVAGLLAVAILGIVAAGVYALSIDPALVPGGYGAPALGLTARADLMRSNAMAQSFVAIALLLAVVAAAGSIIAAATLPEKRRAGTARAVSAS